jgi:hypothetical protein
VLEALGAPLTPVVAHTPVAPAPEPAKDAVAMETDSALAGELDKLFDELKKNPEPDADNPPAALLSSDAAPIETETAVAEVGDPAAVAVDDATTAQERGGLIEDEAEEPAVDETPVLIEEKLPVYLKPLEWINAPFAFLPDRARDLLGTIGIVMLMNAAAILAYVRFLRKH